MGGSCELGLVTIKKKSLLCGLGQGVNQVLYPQFIIINNIFIGIKILKGTVKTKLWEFKLQANDNIITPFGKAINWGELKKKKEKKERDSWHLLKGLKK